MANKNAIIGAAVFIGLIILSAVFFYNKNVGNNFGKVFLLKKSGELSFADLAKYSECSFPADSAPVEGKYDAFAKCLTEKGVKMYGAFWCGHCQNQKKAFGDSFKYVDYQECTIDGKQNSFAQVCQDAGIEGYPTWVFPKKAR